MEKREVSPEMKEFLKRIGADPDVEYVEYKDQPDWLKDVAKWVQEPNQPLREDDTDHERDNKG